jgi:hypothetical protein
MFPWIIQGPRRPAKNPNKRCDAFVISRVPLRIRLNSLHKAIWLHPTNFQRLVALLIKAHFISAGFIQRWVCICRIPEPQYGALPVPERRL